MDLFFGKPRVEIGPTHCDPSFLLVLFPENPNVNLYDVNLISSVLLSRTLNTTRMGGWFMTVEFPLHFSVVLHPCCVVIVLCFLAY